MRIHLRADSANGIHTRFTVFVNGVSCGQLCMREAEAAWFHNLVAYAIDKRYPWTVVADDEFMSSGEWDMGEAEDDNK